MGGGGGGSVGSLGKHDKWGGVVIGEAWEVGSVGCGVSGGGVNGEVWSVGVWSMGRLVVVWCWCVVRLCL